MFPLQFRVRIVRLLCVAALSCCLAGDNTIGLSVRPSQRMQKLPSHTLWTWQRSENLSAIDPTTTAIAYLDQTVRIGASVKRVPRTQGFAYPTKAVLIRVVRIEVLRDAKLDRAVLDEVVEAILRSAGARSAALQIDFDATRSQQEFYRRLLVLLRRRMPPALPLSMTALVSWCSYDDWLGGLPVDEAVPMFFRMGP